MLKTSGKFQRRIRDLWTGPNLVLIPIVRSQYSRNPDLVDLSGLQSVNLVVIRLSGPYLCLFKSHIYDKSVGFCQYTGTCLFLCYYDDTLEVPRGPERTN